MTSPRESIAPSALRDLLSQLGRDVDDADRVVFRGSDPVFACRFPLGELAAAALAGCGLAVSELWELRTGRRQRVEADVRRAGASLLSFIFLRTGEEFQARGSSTTTLYPARGGRWVHLHGGFPHLHEGTLRVLGCSADAAAEEVAAAVAARDAQELEDALAEAGMCGAMVRSAEEWAAHPQGWVLGGLPVVEVIRIGDSDPEPLAAGARPLSGIRALDLTRVLAGPTCGRTLAEHGADVLRVTSPTLPSIPPFVVDTGHGKLSTELQLDRDDNLERLRELVRDADVFAQGYRSGSLARRGLGPDELSALRPGLIYVSMNCYGHEGPWRERPGWEQLAQTVSGLAQDHGGAAHPSLVPCAACDYTTGYLAAFGTLVALARRTREGGSYHVRASLTQTGMWLHRYGSDALDPDAPSAGEEAARSGSPGGFSTNEIADWSTETETPYGRIRHLTPVIELSETPPRWERPSVPLGTHPPIWP
jgi:crotonobetainyl-CoA:carnitine CoA-transferase CaiB-like acyl-CoA transferase